MKQSILLVNVVYDGDYSYQQELPLGLAAVGAFLRQEGYSVKFRQCFASRGEQEINAVADEIADIYGFQINMVNGKAVMQAIRTIKSKRLSAITICGGPFLASRAEDMLKEEPALDYVVIGEGEYTCKELFSFLGGNWGNLHNISGLVWRRTDGSIIKNPSRVVIHNLDELPMVARDFLEDARKDPTDGGLLESVRMISSRGCVGNCTFCCVNLYSKVLGGKRWRGRSPKHVVDELEYLVNTYKAKVFNFSDSSFEDPGMLGKQRSREICEEIIRRGLKVSIKIYLRCETMKTDADIELLKLYKQAGIDMIIAGAESASDYELELYSKHSRVKDNYRIIDILKELDCFYNLIGFIMFGPYSTPETLRSNIEFLYETGFAHNPLVVANSLMLFRDSKLYDKLKSEGRIKESNSCWELPQYEITDPVVVKMMNDWAGLIAKYPIVDRVNNLQFNLANLIARMTNPMNAKVLDALKDDFEDLKAGYNFLNQTVGRWQHALFLFTLDSYQNNIKNEICFSQAISSIYESEVDGYERLYQGFLNKITDKGFSLSGIVFENFTSAMIKKVDNE